MADLTIRETGRVLEIDRDRIRVLVHQRGQACAHRAGCGRCVLKPDGSAVLEAPLPPESADRLAVGQDVQLEIDVASPYRAALLLFVLPILGLIVGGIVGVWLTTAGVLPQGAAALSAAGMALFGGAVFLAPAIVLERRRRTRRPPVRLL